MNRKINIEDAKIKTATITIKAISVKNLKGNKTMKLLLNTILSTIFLFTACAPVPQSYQPVIDTGNRNFDYSQYYRDLHDCQEYAKRVSLGNQAAGEALAGAAFGAVIGAILGSSCGYASRVASTSAGIGGLMGAVHGAGNAVKQQKTIIKKCMTGRGYKVLE